MMNTNRCILCVEKTAKDQINTSQRLQNIYKDTQELQINGSCILQKQQIGAKQNNRHGHKGALSFTYG